MTKNSPILALLGLLFCGGAAALAASPNMQSALLHTDLSQYQSRSERGAAQGYMPLSLLSGTQPVAAPRFIFPSFADDQLCPPGAVWVKSGTGAAATIAPLVGFSAESNRLTSGNVSIGQVSDSNDPVYGIRVTGVSSPLVLAGGTASTPYIFLAPGQTLAGASSSTYQSASWSIGPSGGFDLGGGTIGGSITGGTGATLDLPLQRLTTSGSTAFIFSGSGGVVVPSTASTINYTHALNVQTANQLYPRTSGINTWTGVQSFQGTVAFLDSAIPIAKIASLQTSLDARVRTDGSSVMSGTLNMGGYRITNIANPVNSGDAISKSYLMTTMSAKTDYSADYSDTVVLSDASLHKFTITATWTPAVNTAGFQPGRPLTFVVSNASSSAQYVIFSSPFKLSGSSTLHVSGTRSASISFMSDGTNFYEIGRAANLTN